MTYSLTVSKTATGYELVGEAPPRIHVSHELLSCCDPAVLTLDDQGDATFTLTDVVLRYRRVAVERLHVEFERVG